MANATASLGDIERFETIAQSCSRDAAEAAEMAAGNVRAWCEHIREEKQQCDHICACIVSEIYNVQKTIEDIESRTAQLSARLASIDPVIIETYVDQDGNEQTVTKPNPEYTALEARISSLEQQKAELEQKLKNLNAELHEVEQIARRLEMALADLEPLDGEIRRAASEIGEYAERAAKLLESILQILSGYISVQLNGSTSGGAYAGGGAVGISGGGSGTYGGTVAPSRRSPRILAKTAQGWTSTPDGMMYNSPFETGRKLISNQGSVVHYRQDCGVVSCANVARMAGLDVSEREALERAINNNCCSRHRKTFFRRRDIDGGGTFPEDRQKLLKQFGIDSHLEPQNVKNISDRVSEGRGVIISVRADKLWQNPNQKGLHAITVTSVLKNPDGSVHGFYVCDSGTGGIDASRFYTAQEIAAALTPNRYMNVTTSIIR